MHFREEVKMRTTPFRISTLWFLFALLPLAAAEIDATSRPSTIRQAHFYNVLEYGGYTDTAIQQAIDATHSALPHSSDNSRIMNNSFQGKANAIVMNGTAYIVEVTNNFFQGQRGHAVLVRNSSGIGGHTLIFRDNWFRATAAGASMLRFEGRTATVNVHVTNNTFDHIQGTEPMINWVTPGRTFYCMGNWFEGFGGANQTAILWRGDSATIWGN